MTQAFNNSLPHPLPNKYIAKKVHIFHSIFHCIYNPSTTPHFPFHDIFSIAFHISIHTLVHFHCLPKSITPIFHSGIFQPQTYINHSAAICYPRASIVTAAAVAPKPTPHCFIPLAPLLWVVMLVIVTIVKKIDFHASFCPFYQGPEEGPSLESLVI